MVKRPRLAPTTEEKHGVKLVHWGMRSAGPYVVLGVHQERVELLAVASGCIVEEALCNCKPLKRWLKADITGR